jgi:hypothetical protein
VLFREGEVIFKTSIVGGTCMVHLTPTHEGQSSPSDSIKAFTSVDINLLHRRAGHCSNEALKRLFGIKNPKVKCDACFLSKSHRLVFPSHLPEAHHPLESVHMDLSGKITPSSCGGGLYYFKITDWFTRFRHVFILSAKSDTFNKFVEYYNNVTTFHGRPIKNVIFDGGGEFNSKAFTEFLKQKGVSIHVTAPYTPQQNAVAERGNRTTSEKARALLKQANLPAEYWGEAVCTAVFLENITPTRQLKWKTPHELWFDRQFDVSRLRPFGCKAFINLPKLLRHGKFGDTAKKGLLIGYQLGMHNWRILLPATVGHKLQLTRQLTKVTE